MSTAECRQCGRLRTRCQECEPDVDHLRSRLAALEATVRVHEFTIRSVSTQRDDAVARADSLRDALLDVESEPWRGQAEIVRDWMPEFPRDDTRPLKFVVRWRGLYLRHSHGVRQRPFWDVYPDEAISEAWAIVSLANAPVPPPLAGYPMSPAMKAIEKAGQ